MNPIGNQLLSWSALALTLALVIAAPAQDETVEKEQRKQEQEQKELTARIDKLIRQLDDDDFQIRESAMRELMPLVEAAHDALTKAARNESAEVRWRAQWVLEKSQEQMILDAFRKIASQKDDAKVDVEEGMFLLSRIVDPKASRKEINRQFDALASEVRKKLAEGPAGKAEPSKADPKAVVAAMRKVLFKDHKFIGNEDDYDNPDNSAIHRVLESKKGLPILLSQVMVAVGRRLDVPIVGIPVPSRYMVKYDGRRAPGASEEKPGDDIYIDAYAGGNVLTITEIDEIVGGDLDPMRDLAPAANRATLLRMMQNLETHCLGREKADQAKLVAACRQILAAAEAENDRR